MSPPAKQKKRGRTVRADRRLVELGLAESEREAQALILAGKVFETDGDGRERKLRTSGEAIKESSTLRVVRPEHPYVGRGGLKLEAALDRFGIDPKGLVAADIGVSTGGFTDCLLIRGASKVFAVDVGYGQTAWKIRSDPKVVLLERTNARELAPGAFGQPVDLMVVDLSFIGLLQVLPALVPQLADGARIVLLVKPQFEVKREEVGPGGVVEDEAARRRSVDRVIAGAQGLGLVLDDEIESPIHGADGNLEFLVAFTKQAKP
jgi:23S rRNA (cytidine1920-2'-O)/16S rRNA (cytidine1409-2'-O)-methyltransferase